MEGLSPREKGAQKHNYDVEMGTESKCVESKETKDESIFRIAVSCLLNKMLSSSTDLMKHFCRSQEELRNPSNKPEIATVSGSTLGAGRELLH
jgi:hypothetical protein